MGRVLGGRAVALGVAALLGMGVAPAAAQSGTESESSAGSASGDASSTVQEIDSETDGDVVLPEITVTMPAQPQRNPGPARAPQAGQTGGGGPVEAQSEAPPVAVPVRGAGFSDESFSPMTVETEGEIERNPAQSFGDLLFTTPGVTSSTFAPGASRPIVRGLSNERVRIQENGIGIQDVSTLGGDHAVPIDPLATDQVEVVRGPATLRYGSGSVGGLVNASNNRIPVDLAPNTHRLEMQGAHVTVDDSLQGVLKFDSRAQNVAVHVDAFGRNAEDYDTPLGIQENSFVETQGGSAGTTLFFDRGFIGTSVSRFTSDYGIPGGEEAELGIHIDMEQTRWTNRAAYRPRSGPIQEMRFWLGYSDYSHDEIGQEHEHEHEEGEEEAEEHHEHEEEGEVVHGTFAKKAWEARAEFEHVPVQTRFGALNGSLGVQWSNDDLRTQGEAAELLAPNTTDQLAAYLFEEIGLNDRLRLQAAGRVESDRVDGRAPILPPGTSPATGLLPPPDEIATRAASRDFAPVSGSIGLLRDLPNGIVGRATAEYSQRAPSVSELFSKGSHHASGTFEIGDPNLGLETAQSVELGIGRQTGTFRFDANAYYTKFDDFIYQELTGVTCNEEFESCGIANGEFDQVITGQQDATFTGAELQGEYDIGQLAGGIFGVSGQYDFVHAKLADGSYVPLIPPHRLGGGLYWRDDHWEARTSLLHAFRQDEVAENETETPGYNLLDASLSWTGSLEAGGYAKSLTLGIAGDNLLDEEIRNAASYKADQVLLPGRSFKLFAKAVF